MVFFCFKSQGISGHKVYAKQKKWTDGRTSLEKRSQWPGLGKAKRFRSEEGLLQGVRDEYGNLHSLSSWSKPLQGGSPSPPLWSEDRQVTVALEGWEVQAEGPKGDLGAPMHSSMAQEAMLGLPKGRGSWENNGGTSVFPVWIKMKTSDQQRPLTRGQMEISGQVPVSANANDVQRPIGAGPHWFPCWSSFPQPGLLLSLLELSYYAKDKDREGELWNDQENPRLTKFMQN